MDGMEKNGARDEALNDGMELVRNRIDRIVRLLYKLEVNAAEKAFVELLDALSAVPHSEEFAGILGAIHDAYVRKDYVLFSDLLIYDLKAVLGLEPGIKMEEDAESAEEQEVVSAEKQEGEL